MRSLTSTVTASLSAGPSARASRASIVDRRRNYRRLLLPPPVVRSAGLDGVGACLAHAIVAHSWEPRLLRWRCRVAPRSKSGVSGTDGRLSLGTWTFRRPPWLRVAHPPWSASPPRQKDRYAAVRYRYQPSGPPLSMIRRRFWRSRTPMTDHARAESLGALSHSATPLRDQRGSRIRRPCNTEVREGDAESDAQSSTTVPTVGSTLPSSSST
jgi:hypothetical protein